MARVLVFSLIGLFFTANVSGQRQLYVVGSYDFGGFFGGNKYQRNGGILQSGYFRPDAYNSHYELGTAPFNNYIGLHFRASNHLGIETGAHYSEFEFTVHDDKYQRLNNIADLPSPDPLGHQGIYADHGSFYAFHHYNGAYLSGYYFFWPNAPIYVSLGLQSNYFPGNPDASTSYISPSGETLTMDLHYSHRFLRPYVEFLWGSYLGRGLLCSFFKYSASGTFVTGDYKDVIAGNIVSTDHVAQNGDEFSLGLRIGVDCFRKRSNSFSSPAYKNRKPARVHMGQRGRLHHHRAAPHHRARSMSKKKANNRQRTINHDNSRSREN